MAIDPLTTNLARWNAAWADYSAGTAALSALEAHTQSRVHHEVVALAAEAKARLFRIPAPTYGAVRKKLESFWPDIWAEEYGTHFKRTILGDLRRLELLRAGVEAEEASPGMDLDQVSTEFAKAAAEYDRYLELRRQGPSDEWGASTTSDITALMDEAEAKMLSLPAPNVASVEKKLGVMWVDDRYDPIESTTAHVTILRDLRRLMAE